MADPTPFEVVGEGTFDADADEYSACVADQQTWTSEIEKVVSGAVKVEARTIKVGDMFFDAYGGTHAIVEVKTRRGWLHTVRDDGWEDIMSPDDLITILRGEVES